MKLKIVLLKEEFSVCKIESLQAVDWSGRSLFVTKTEEEISLVCETDAVPADVQAVEHGWRALKIDEILDFGMIGILADISAILAKNSVSLFVVSTYNTDYILVKTQRLERAISSLTAHGYEIRREDFSVDDSHSM